VCAAVTSGSVERAVHVDQARLGPSAIGASAGEVMKHSLCAGRTDAKDRSLRVRAAAIGRAVKSAAYVDETRLGVSAIGVADEAV
jgi:hypothetical protein